jgi:hypothetical protein
VANRKQARLAEIQRFIEDQRIEEIGEEEFAGLGSRLGGIGDHELRRLLRLCGCALSPMVEGVRQESFDALERTLAMLAVEYERSGSERRRAIRRLVITAKDHARYAAHRAKQTQKRAEKEEMVEWMLVWLENPPVFCQWVRLRRASSTGRDV